MALAWPGLALAQQAPYEQAALPKLQTYCLKCHAGEDAEGDFDLKRFVREADLRHDPKTWVKVVEKLESGEMPPEGARAMPLADRQGVRDWITAFLKAQAQAHAGDPGPVVLRRLTNAQYAYTVRDLTGLDLDLTREFPADSAAGEGFTSTGGALVMSASTLTQYLDAAKKIADHAEFLPDGFRFSNGTSARDWTDEAVARIRSFYGQFTDDSDGNRVNLQGIVFQTNGGGRLPWERYLQALLDDREAIQTGEKSPDAAATERGLSAKYMRRLWQILQSDQDGSPPLDLLRSAFRSARPGEAFSVPAPVEAWRQGLWRFTSVGHIGKVGGPKAWMEPVEPRADRAEVRVKFPTEAKPDGEVSLFLAVDDAGDGPEGDVAIWKDPRIVTPGRPDLPLRDVRALSGRLAAHRKEVLAHAAASLDIAAELLDRPEVPDLEALARKSKVPADVLATWLDYLGIGQGPPTIPANSMLSGKIAGGGGYEFVRGWGSNETPNAVANSSDQAVRIPGLLKAHGVAVHPSPTLRTVVGWRSPVRGPITIQAKLQHDHPECGNGVVWRLEIRRNGAHQLLDYGRAQGLDPVPVGPFEGLPIAPGEIVSLSIGALDGNHVCDLTTIDLTIRSGEAAWDLAADVSPSIEAGNPHDDRLGNPGVWSFFTEPDRPASADSSIPAGSLLARWMSSPSREAKHELAREIQALLDGGRPGGAGDAVLLGQLTSLRGPLLGGYRPALVANDPTNGSVGLDPARFGRLPDGPEIEPTSLATQAPSMIEVRLPAELVAGSEFVATGILHPSSGREGSVRFAAGLNPPDLPSMAVSDAPIVVLPGSKRRATLASGLDFFRRQFPPVLCYNRIVPVDEVVTLTLHYREDGLLKELMLDDRQAAELDRLWDELHFVSRDALTLVDAYEQLMEYATQDADPKVFEPLRKPILERAAAFRKALVDAEPKQLEAVVAFATRVDRRPLTAPESSGLRTLYRTLRDEEIPHDAAIRLTLARLFASPAFLYRVEDAGPGEGSSALPGWALANRLSYFLWSSQPDAELSRRANDLAQTEPLIAESRRMLRDDRTRRLAEEFACQWLQVYDFATHDEKSERHFPTFAGLRSAIHEETIRFFTDIFQNDRSILLMLDADHTFLNEELAGHYGIPNVQGTEWRRVDGVRRYGRGGLLGLASTLAKQSGASRTSPILRGNWVSEVLLGEKLPRPPKDVPLLPEDEEATDGLTVRQLVEKHTSDPRCSGCHQRIDPIGFALESYDAIGRFRSRDLADRPIDAHTRLPDGSEVDGLDGLRRYLMTTRRDAFVRQFCRKLLGFALGRSVQLSDEPLLDAMRDRLKARDYRFSAAVEEIVTSRQFREIRGRDFADAGF